MDTDPAPPDDVALSARPPLLADCLRVLLEPDIEVAVVDEPSDRRYAIALWTPGAASVDAEVVVRLDHLATEGRDCAAVLDQRGEVVSRLRDLDDLLRFVEDRTGGTGQ